MIVNKKGWHRTATTSLPLLHSCPGGVRRELVVSAGAKVTFSEVLNKEVGSFFKEFLVELSHSLLAFSHWPVSMLECLNDWMRKGMMNIEYRMKNIKGPSFWTSAAEARMVKNLPLWIPIYSEDSSVTLFDRFLRMTLKRVSLYNFHFPLYTLLP